MNMQKNQPGTSDIRLAELMAALSIATDLGMGQPIEYALCVCVLAVRLGKRSDSARTNYGKSITWHYCATSAAMLKRIPCPRSSGMSWPCALTSLPLTAETTRKCLVL